MPSAGTTSFRASPWTFRPSAIDVHSVINEDYLEFVEAGGYGRRELWSEEGWHWKSEHAVEHPVFWEKKGGSCSWMWRGQWEAVELPPAWPVYVSHAEASAYARWKGGRIPSESEYHRAAFGTPRR